MAMGRKKFNMDPKKVLGATGLGSARQTSRRGILASLCSEVWWLKVYLRCTDLVLIPGFRYWLHLFLGWNFCPGRGVFFPFLLTF